MLNFAKRSVLATIVALMPSSLPASAAPPEWRRPAPEYERRIDYFGGDYKTFVPVPRRGRVGYGGSNLAEQCLKACAHDARCVAYTFVKPTLRGGLREARGKCYLKNARFERRSSRCCISGKPDVPTDRHEASFNFSLRPSFQLKIGRPRLPAGLHSPDEQTPDGTPLLWNNAESQTVQYLQAPLAHPGVRLALPYPGVDIPPRKQRCIDALASSGTTRVNLRQLFAGIYICVRDDRGRIWRLYIREKFGGLRRPQHLTGFAVRWSDR